jgi:hypothetical protein
MFIDDKSINDHTFLTLSSLTSFASRIFFSITKYTTSIVTISLLVVVQQKEVATGCR